MIGEDFIEGCNFIDVATEDEFTKIKECLEEFSEDNGNQIKLSPISPIKAIYGYMTGYDQELEAFANRYKGEPVIRQYLGKWINAAQNLPEVLPESDDAVAHPKHYNFGKYEPIDVIADWGLNFNLGNTVKYISRAGRKDPNKTLEDLKKAKFYLDYEIEHFGEEK